MLFGSSGGVGERGERKKINFVLIFWPLGRVKFIQLWEKGWRLLQNLHHPSLSADETAFPADFQSGYKNKTDSSPWIKPIFNLCGEHGLVNLHWVAKNETEINKSLLGSHDIGGSFLICLKFFLSPGSHQLEVPFLICFRTAALK